MAYPGRQDSVTSTGERRQDVTEGAIKQLGEAFQRIQELETKLHEQKLEHKQEVEESREAIIILEDERVKNLQLLQDSEEDFRRQLVDEQAKRRQEADLFQDEQRRLQDTLASFKHEKEQLQALADQTESKVRQVEQNYADKLKEWDVERDLRAQAEAGRRQLQTELDAKAEALSVEKATVQRLEARTQQLQGQNEQLHEKRDSLFSQLEDLEKKFDQSSQESIRKTASLELELHSLAQEKSDLQSRHAAKVQEVQQLEAERQQLKVERQQLTSEIEELSSATGTMRDEAQHQRQEMEEAYSRLQEELEMQRATCATHLAEVKAKEVELRAATARADEAEAARVSSVAAAEARREELEQDFGRKLATAQEERISAEQTAGAKAKLQQDQLATLTRDLEGASNELAKLRGQHRDLELAYQSKSQELDLEKQRATEEGARLQQELSEVQQMKADVEAASSKNSQQLQADLAAKAAELAEESKARESLEAAGRQMQQQCDELQNQCRQRSSEIQDLTERLEASNLELTRKTSAFEKGERELTSEKADLERRCGDLRQECDNLSGQVSDLSQKLEASSRELSRKTADFEQEGQKAAGEKADLERRCSELQQECGNLSSEVQDLSQKLEASNQELSRRKADFEQEGQKAAGEKSDLERRCSELQQECGNLSQKLEASNQELSRRTADFEQEGQKAAGEKADLERRCSELQEECGRLSSDLKDMSRKLEASSQELSRTQAELESELGKAGEERSLLEKRRLELERSCDELREERRQLGSKLEEQAERAAEMQQEELRQRRDMEEAQRGAAERSAAERDALQQQLSQVEQAKASSQADAETKSGQIRDLEAQVAALDLQLRTEEQSAREAHDKLSMQCEQLQKDCERLSSEVSSAAEQLEASHEELTRKVAAFQTSEEQLEAEKADLHRRCEDLQEKCASLSSAVDNRDKELDAAQKSFTEHAASAGAEAEQLRSQQAQVEQRLKEAEERCRTLQLEFDAEVAGMKEEHGTARRAAAAAEEHLRAESAKAQEELARKSSEFEEDRQRLGGAHAELDQRHRLLAGQHETLQAEHVQLQEKHEALSSSAAAQREEAERKQKELEEAHGSAAEEAQQLQQRLAQSSQESEALLQEQQRLQSQVEEHLKTTSRISESCSEQERQLAEKEKEVEQLNFKMQQLKDDLEQEKQQLLAQLSNMETSYEQKLTTMEEQASWSASELRNEYKQELDQEKALFEESLAAAKRRLEQVQSEHSARIAKEEGEAAELQRRHREELTKLQAACAATGQKLEEERMQTTSRITELNAGHDRKVAERDEKVELLGGQLREQAMELEKERQSHAARVAEIEASYEQKVFTLEEAATALKSEYHQDMDQQKAHFEESLEQAAQRLENLQATHGKSLEGKKEEALELQARQKEEIQRLQDQHDELARQLQEHARNNFEEMRRKAEDLQGKSDQLQQDLAQAQDQAQRLAAEKEGLKSEMTQAQIDADHLIGETKASYERRLLEKSQALAEMEEAYRKVEANYDACIKELQAAQADYNDRVREKETDLADKTARIRVLSNDLAEQDQKNAHLEAEVAQYQKTSIEMDRNIAELRSANERTVQQLQADKDRAEQTIQQLRADVELLEREKDQVIMDKEEMRHHHDHEKQEMSKKTEQFYEECAQQMKMNDDKLSKTMAEFRSERDRLSAEKAEMNRRMQAYREECQTKMKQDEKEMIARMEAFRAECDQRMKEEQESMAKMTQELHDRAHEQVAKEQQAAERHIQEIRKHTEEQLQSEREVSDSVRRVLRELPPLQAAMELGDLAGLEMELSKWRGQVLSDRFGDCRGVVEAVVNMAKERVVTWRGVDHTWKEVIREVERLPGSLSSLTNQCQRLFRALKEAQLTKMDLRRSDPSSLEKALEVLLAWKDKAMVCNNSVQTLIIQKVMNCPQLGPFDFADLDICLRLVDRPEGGVNQVFLSRAAVVVEDEKVAPKDLKGLLAHIETMLFFLKYAKSEDLSLTHREFKKQTYPLHPLVTSCLDSAQREYGPGKELVDLSRSHSLMDGNDVASVLQAMRPSRPGAKSGLDIFREIFYQWALQMRKQFNLLVLPHHTQVVCLLAFQHFLEAAPGRDEIRALIAQVGTGEGKSMIVAALAIYVVVALRKKVHVVVDDETLLDRDFNSFRKLFENFTVEENGKRRPLSAMLCVSEERLSGSKGAGLAARVDPEADICYCEAKHVQSFYASIARSEHGKRDFDSYSGRVLILDEVDALVIDEEPNEPFVYPNPELSQLATSTAQALLAGASPHSEQLSRLRSSGHPAAPRVVHETCKEWERGQKMISGEDYVYSKESGRYCALHAGRANPKAWSLALECRNFKDGLSKEIFYQERVFVMSRPRVFRRYHRILGLSGSIGSEPERKFLQETYRAAFFEVPPFLKTCRGSPFHEPLPAKLGSSQAAVYVEENVEAQTSRIAEVAFEARERVPVLIIAKDRMHADSLLESMQMAARSRGFGTTSQDVVRSLSRTLYEAEPEQWKENLNRATMPLGATEGRDKSWRITVTDRRGGRGTDYRVDDSDVDGAGGLLLIPAVVPTSQREWTQFLGRTARQDRHGQYTAVLCAKDYAALSSKYKESMPQGGCGLEPVKMVLNWGDRDTAERIKGSAALYNCGVRVNELCEEVFGKRAEILKDPQARERLVDVCQRLRWMSVREVDDAFARLPSFDPKKVPTEAKDLGRPETAPMVGSMALPPGGGPAVASHGGAKVVIFCLDWSASMKSNDTRTALNRFQTCVQCILRILKDQVRDNDLVGVVCFGPNVQTIIAPTPKGVGGRMLQTRIASLQPANAGGTCFYDAVLECLRMLGKPDLVPREALRWLVCLTDGDDLGSSLPNARGQNVTKMLASGNAPAALQMVMITVGNLKAENVQVIQSWVRQVTALGGKGLHLGDKDATGIAKAFEVVAEFLAAETGGATEC